MLINQIDKAVCLILDKRYDRWPKLLEQCQNVGINPEAFIVGRGMKFLYNHEDVDEPPPVFPGSILYPTWFQRNNAYNAFLSHKKILEQAKKDKVKTLLLLEDDAFIEADFLDIISKVESFFEQNHWDMIYFGSYQQRHMWNDTNNEHVVQTNGCGGLHGCLMKANVIEKISDFDALGPLDWQIGRFIHNIFSTYAIHPCIISQEDKIYSEVEGSVLNKPTRYFKN